VSKTERERENVRDRWGRERVRERYEKRGKERGKEGRKER
jgi:hypothetical protein